MESWLWVLVLGAILLFLVWRGGAGGG